MDVGEEVLTGIRLAGNESVIDESVFKNIIKESVMPQVLNTDRDRVPPQSGEEKKALLALSSFFTECARKDSSDDEIRGILDEQGFSLDRIKKFIHSFQQNKDLFRHNISRISSFGRAKIVDVDWRLDYNIKSSQGEKVNQLSYLVDIHTQEPGQGDIKTVSFNCSLEQLQDLVGKLKDAVRCVEKQVTT